MAMFHFRSGDSLKAISALTCIVLSEAHVRDKVTTYTAEANDGSLFREGLL